MTDSVNSRTNVFKLQGVVGPTSVVISENTKAFLIGETRTGLVTSLSQNVVPKPLDLVYTGLPSDLIIDKTKCATWLRITNNGGLAERVYTIDTTELLSGAYFMGSQVGVYMVKFQSDAGTINCPAGMEPATYGQGSQFCLMYTGSGNFDMIGDLAAIGDFE